MALLEEKVREKIISSPKHTMVKTKNVPVKNCISRRRMTLVIKEILAKHGPGLSIRRKAVSLLIDSAEQHLEDVFYNSSYMLALMGKEEFNHKVLAAALPLDPYYRSQLSRTMREIREAESDDEAEM